MLAVQLCLGPSSLYPGSSSCKRPAAGGVRVCRGHGKNSSPLPAGPLPLLLRDPFSSQIGIQPLLVPTLFYWLILGKEQCSEFMKCCLSLLGSPELGRRERGGYITFISLPHEHFIKQMYVTHRVLGMKPLSSNTFKLLCQ